MIEKLDLRTRLLRLVVLLLTVVTLISAAVHVGIQVRLNDVPPSAMPMSIYALLSAQTWLQATMVGGLLLLIGYFVILPIAKQVEEGQAAIEEKERALDFASRHDKVTGFLDRRHFYDLIDHTCLVGQRHNHAVGLLRLQLNGSARPKSEVDFRAADGIAVEVAGRIERATRAADYVARLGEEEFAILVPIVTSVEGLGRLADRLIGDLSELVTSGEHERIAACSLGVAVAWPTEDRDARDLLLRASQALSEAQEQGGSTWRYHASAVQGLNDRLSATG